jgi:shikimate kinase
VLKGTPVTISRKTIYLTGFMGSGKSSVGPKLAAVLGLDFVDLDVEIEKGTGRSIPIIFAQEGEAAFRKLEAEALASIPAGGSVVALGGGALMNQASLAAVLGAGTLIYLKASAGTLKARLDKEQAGRPVLEGKSDLLETIRELMDSRGPVYEKAHHTIETDEMAPDEVVSAVVALLQEE